MILQYVAVAVALAALGISVSAARSDQYPTLNVAPVCHGITEQSDLEAGLRQGSFEQCLQNKLIGKKGVVHVFSRRQEALRGRSMGGESSYTDLLTCLEMARDVRQPHSQANSSSAPAQQIPPAPVGHRQPTQ